MIVKKWNNKSDLYCANLSNYISSIERNKSMIKHKMLVNEIISDKKKKSVSFNMVNGSHGNHLTHHSVDVNNRKKTSLLNYSRVLKSENKIFLNLYYIQNWLHCLHLCLIKILARQKGLMILNAQLSKGEIHIL